MVYIRSASGVSVQPPASAGAVLRAVAFPAPVIEPDYKQFINPGMLRRMSPIIKYGVAGGVDCLQRAGIASPNAVVTGTGLGCLRDTQKFMETFLTVKEETLPPTAFIQSTHNTIAGQLALLVKCYGYNMTFVQNGLSFEYALLDGKMLSEAGTDNVLVGGADEKIGLLEETAARLGVPQNKTDELSEGAGFFLLSNKNESAVAKLLDVHCETAADIDEQKLVAEFLKKNNIDEPAVDLLLYADNNFSGVGSLASVWKGAKLNFINYTGYYFTNSAVALNMAVEILQGRLPEELKLGSAPKTILLFNRYLNKSLGLTLIQQP